MPAGDDSEEKTEDATPRQRDRAREEGRVTSSREVGTLAVLTAATLGIYYLGPYMTSRMSSVMIHFLENLSTIDLSQGGAVALLRETFLRVLLVIGPFMLCLVIASIGGFLIQVGFLITGKPLQPNPSRINPIEGAKRIFSAHMVAETLKSIFKFIVVTWVSYIIISPVIPAAAALMDTGPEGLIHAIITVGYRIACTILIFLVIVAVSDYAFQRWEFEKSIRMSRYEIKQELKETEGDPQIKARVRSIRQQQARQRMMAEVPRAEVVITNPTHYSIALRYDPIEREAPHVVAKGQGLIALRIREIAQEHEIPLYEEPWLARQLYRTCDIGDTVPVDLWQAVAKVLAYVRALDRKRMEVGA
jgi:flagellar biosynthetic protein FlhB